MALHHPRQHSHRLDEPVAPVLLSWHPIAECAQS
ncbi:Uncharacterised protein [Vibrio cholerae]|nr:Uncharacterised protein [Vibrio cholerae]